MFVAVVIAVVDVMVDVFFPSVKTIVLLSRITGNTRRNSSYEHKFPIFILPMIVLEATTLVIKGYPLDEFVVSVNDAGT